MRLLFVTHSFSPPGRPLSNVGGMQRVAMELDAALGRMDRPDLVYDIIKLEASWSWIHVRILPFLVSAWFSLRRRIRRGEVDVILFSSMVTASLAVSLRPLMDRHGVRAAAIVHGQDVTKPVAAYQRFVPRVFAPLAAVLPVSGPTGEACAARGLPATKIRVVHNGVKLDRFPAFERPAGARAPLPFRRDLSEGDLLLCSVGRQVRRKGFAWFIENVMPQLPPHVHYWLGGDGPEAGAIQAAIGANGLQDRVRLLGRLGDGQLKELYQGADLFVMPNIPVEGDMEGFGIVMLEAAINGLPTVAARLEGIREVITDGANGYFVESGDVEGYVRRILALDADRAQLASLSSSSREHVARTFGWDAVASHYVDALQSLSSGT
ncbi:MAG: glycosyltransferase family 4 protein [Bacteroidetes bacterium]|nr:glycosyltransferase family 4 protein [Bacteroidota bacterium]